MAAFETPWIEDMTPSPPRTADGSKSRVDQGRSSPTLAAFSPSQTGASPATKQRSTILVHQKSPLLVATPPAVTRALAFSHPFLLPLTRILGLVTWASGDPWESFLVVAGFWAITLYGDVVMRYAGPLVVVIIVILGMYSRRYSPLSSSGWTGEKLDDKKDATQSNMKHQKSLDEIVETLNIFTSRCNVLLEPFMQLTDFLSTQRTATSTTTRPALTSLFIRILLVTPVWIGLTLPPFYILTTKRIVLLIGTLILSWHSRPARVSRTILWRSKTVRRIISFVTGLKFNAPAAAVSSRKKTPPALPPRHRSQQDVANSLASKTHSQSPGVRFTFVVFENQRRWLGLGWTSTLLAYERVPWTDEHLNPSDSKDEFRLPEIEGGTAKWRWVPGSEWHIEGGGRSKASEGADGWIYYDNKWGDGKRGQDGWGRYTRRRKWYRDAELVEVNHDESLDDSTATLKPSSAANTPGYAPPDFSQAVRDGDDSGSSQMKRRGFFRRGRRSSAQSSGDFSGATTLRSDDDDAHPISPHHQRNGDWGIDDDVKMGLG